MLPSTRRLLQFLQKNPGVRSQISAPRDKTLLYAGRFFRPVWQELADFRRANPAAADKQILPDVLARIRHADLGNATLLDRAKEIDREAPLAWKENGFIVWRALSGLFAANAQGVVSFYVGSEVTREQKVFAATEIAVLSRNVNVDPMTHDILAYYQRCIQSKNADLNFAYIAG